MPINRAIVADPAVTGLLTLREVPMPQPNPQEVLVHVATISLNRGEVRSALSAKTAWRPGWDLAGTVVSQDAEGKGPMAGARIVALLPQAAWAEYVAVPVESLAVLPDQVGFAQAATLPVAGLTALHALAHGGQLQGKRVLVTGATGGVGNFAIQLAVNAGAVVAALIRKPEQAGEVQAAGATEVLLKENLAENKVTQFDLILESVGGPQMGAVLGLLAGNGTCVVYGTSAGGEVTLNMGAFYGLGSTTLYGMRLFNELRAEGAGKGLAQLAGLVATGRLKPHISVETSWTDIAKIAPQLMDRSFTGKAVLHIQ